MLKAMLGEAWLAMGANRLRTALTMLGMVIGVGAVVIMIAIGQGAQYAVQQTISTMGSNLYIVLSGSFTAAGVRSGSAGGPTLNVGDAEAMAELDGVSNVAPTHQGSRQLVYGSQNWSTQVIGTTPPYLDARAWNIVNGAAFGDSDVRSSTRVALVGKTVAQNLFGDEDPVGKTMRIQQNPFTVIGVLGSKGQNLDGRDQDDTVIIPLSTALGDFPIVATRRCRAASGERPTPYCRSGGSALRDPARRGRNLREKWGSSVATSKGGDHAALAQVRDLRVLGQRGEGGTDFCRFLAVDRNVVLLEDVERRQRGAAGQRVAGVGMRVQEGAGDRVVEEGGVDGVAAQHDGERQVAAGDAFRQAHQVGADAACSWAKKVPVRPQPTAISSQIRCTS
jgi:hypothetical protein